MVSICPFGTGLTFQFCCSQQSAWRQHGDKRSRCLILHSTALSGHCEKTSTLDGQVGISMALSSFARRRRRVSSASTRSPVHLPNRNSPNFQTSVAIRSLLCPRVSHHELASGSDTLRLHVVGDFKPAGANNVSNCLVLARRTEHFRICRYRPRHHTILSQQH